MDTDATDKLLAAIDGVDRKLDEKNKADTARFAAHEVELREHGDRLTAHDAKFKDHDDELKTHAAMLRDQASLLTTIGHSAARAVDQALDAKRVAGQSVDEATKIVESAIRMHSASIATTVQSAVKSEIAPLVTDLGKVKESDAAKAEAIVELKTSMDALTSMMKGVVKALGHPKLRWLLIVCAALGALAGGAAAGWKAHDATQVTKTHAP